MDATSWQDVLFQFGAMACACFLAYGGWLSVTTALLEFRGIERTAEDAGPEKQDQEMPALSITPMVVPKRSFSR